MPEPESFWETVASLTKSPARLSFGILLLQPLHKIPAGGGTGKPSKKQALKTLLQNPAPKGRRHFFNARGERACERATDDLIARSRVTKSTGDKHSGAANTIPAMPKVNWLSCLYHAAAAHRAWTESPRSPRHSPSRKATLLPEIGGPRPKARSRKFQAAQRSELMQRNM